VKGRAVRPSGQWMRRREQNLEPSPATRNFDSVECGFLVCGRIVCTLHESSDNMPDDLLLTWPGFAVSVLDRFDK
jgi:hypothetical protein